MHRVQRRVAEHLEHAHLPQHPPLRPVRGPDYVGSPVRRGPTRGGDVAVGEGDVMVLEDLAGYGRGGDYDAELGPE